MPYIVSITLTVFASPHAHSVEEEDLAFRVKSLAADEGLTLTMENARIIAALGAFTKGRGIFARHYALRAVDATTLLLCVSRGYSKRYRVMAKLFNPASV